tara:strand:- start:211 stop:780 length:570 start_codon:yes stop_codon:yes gene_type:complete
MKHGKKIARLGRKTAHRKYMLANMASSLIEHKCINTTVTKAKALKRFVEPLITKSKNDSTHNRRIVFRYLRNKFAVTELFRNISQKIGNRPGGYTRIIQLGNRLGDNANMAMIELVDYNSVYNSSKESSKRKRRRRKKSTDSEPLAKTDLNEVVELKEDTPVVEESTQDTVKSKEDALESDKDGNITEK